MESGKLQDYHEYRIRGRSALRQRSHPRKFVEELHVFRYAERYHADVGRSAEPDRRMFFVQSAVRKRE